MEYNTHIFISIKSPVIVMIDCELFLIPYTLDFRITQS